VPSRLAILINDSFSARATTMPAHRAARGARVRGGAAVWPAEGSVVSGWRILAPAPAQPAGEM